MQTKRQIQELLTAAGVSPNRRLGQHFLVDLNLMRLLVDSAQIGRNDVVLEVGTGTGSLTEALAEQAGRVVTVELDPTLASIAQSRLAQRVCEKPLLRGMGVPPMQHRRDADATEPHGPDARATSHTPSQADSVQIINADVLSGKGTINPVVTEAVTQAQARLRDMGHIDHISPIGPTSGRLLLVSNLPYDVASSIMVNLIKGPLLADAMFVTVQREVADRMTARAGGRDYGTLSIFLQATGEVELVRVLKPSVFWPPPGVDSAVVRYRRDHDKSRRILDIDLFSGVVALFIGHRRKMLRACIKQAPPELGGRDLWPQIFEHNAIDPIRRPEELAPEQYVDVANSCHKLMHARST